MACPGGCVNGGGQIKAPSKSSTTSSLTTDAEGYSRNWEDSGVQVKSSEPDMMASERWTDKEWVKKVETAYWNNGQPTPPPSPPASVASLGSTTATSSVAIPAPASTPLKASSPSCTPDVSSRADEVASQVLSDLFAGDEQKRRAMFRTEYRAVVSEVVGLAVKW